MRMRIACLGLMVALLSALASPASAQDAAARRATDDEVERWPPVATFSVLGYDPETGEVGGAVQSRVFSVGNGVLWAEANVGVVATQAIVDVSYGPQGIELLRQGTAPADVVSMILATAVSASGTTRKTKSRASARSQTAAGSKWNLSSRCCARSTAISVLSMSNSAPMVPSISSTGTIRSPATRTTFTVIRFETRRTDGSGAWRKKGQRSKNLKR